MLYLFGKRSKELIMPSSLGSQLIERSCSVKYLGVTFLAYSALSTDTNVIFRKFYATSNCILLSPQVYRNCLSYVYWSRVVCHSTVCCMHAWVCNTVGWTWWD